MDKQELVSKAARITLKGVKTFKGRDGQGLNANIYFDGNKVAEILDEGNGGEPYYRWNDRAFEAYVAAYIQSLNIPDQVEEFGGRKIEMEVNLTYIVNTIVDLAAETKRLKALCKKFAVARLKDGRIVTYNVPFNEKTKAAVLAKFSDVASFVNEEAL